MIERIEHVLLLVEDMERALAFYVDVLGCKLLHRIDRHAMAELRAGASHLDLVDTGSPQGAWALPAASGGRNMDHVCFELGLAVENDVRERLRFNGVPVIEERSDEDERGKTLSLYVRDPSANTVELLMRASDSKPGSTMIATTQPSSQWKAGCPPWEQPYWGEHAAFINEMHELGMFYMGGPLADYSSIVAIVEGDAAALREHMQSDPWIENDVVTLTSLEPWTVLMDPRIGYSWKSPARQK